MGVTATGDSLSYQWMVAPYGSSVFSNIIDNTTYSGSIKDTLSISKPDYMLNGNQYRVQVNGACTSTTVQSGVVNLQLRQAPNPPVITYLPSASSMSSPFCQNTRNMNFALSSNNPAGTVTYGWLTDRFVNATLDTTGGPNHTNAVINIGNSSTGSILIVAVDSFPGTGCYATKDTSIAVSTSSGSVDTARVIWDGINYVCLNNQLTSFLWGYDDSTLVPHLFSAPADAPYVNGQNIMLNSAAQEKTTGGRVWCITGLNGCVNKNYYIDPAPDPKAAIAASIVSPIHLSPNPASDLVLMQWHFSSANDETKVRITDILGREVMTVALGNGSAGQATIHVGTLPEGLYIISVFQNNQLTAAGKLIKIRN
jgi:hypothetical protein